MAENLLSPDSSGSMPGGTTAAENLARQPTPGAGDVNGVPTSNDDTGGNPTSTDAGATGQVPTGGGMAVPPDATLAGKNLAGDGDSLDDSGDVDAGASPGNQGAQPPLPGDAKNDADLGPKITETGAGDGADGGIPTGALDH